MIKFFKNSEGKKYSLSALSELSGENINYKKNKILIPFILPTENLPNCLEDNLYIQP